jgi:predicted GIY-YIG superfamily endonuclease
MWYLHILKCSDDSHYAGRTNDLEARIRKHNSARAMLKQENSELKTSLADAILEVQRYKKNLGL